MNDTTSPCCGAELVHEHDRTDYTGCAECGLVWDTKTVARVMAGVTSAGIADMSRGGSSGPDAGEDEGGPTQDNHRSSPAQAIDERSADR